MQRISPEEFKKRYGEAGLNMFNQPAPTQKTTLERAKDVGIGVAKGLGDSAFTSGNILNEGIKRLPANGPMLQLAKMGQEALTERDLNPFEGDNQDKIKEQLKSDNNDQKAGKALEFFAELFFPTGGASLAVKGTKALGANFDNVATKLASVGDDAVENGMKVKDKLIDMVTTLDDKTKTALQRTPREKFQEVVEQGRKAMMDDRNRTPLEAVGDNVIEALKQTKARAAQIGQTKSAIMSQAKVGFKKVGNIAQRSALNIQKAFSGVKLDAADSKAVKMFQDKLMSLGPNPSLKDVDATIDLLQDQLYKAGRSNAVEVTDRITGRLRSELGKLNSQVKSLGGESYARLNDEYGKTANLVRELNARLGKEGASAGSFVKRLFSPSDARTKELFEELEKTTGQDFFRDARLAKFVMDVLGDPRGRSLLEEIPLSTGGIINRAVRYGAEKLADPIKAAEKYLKE